MSQSTLPAALDDAPPGGRRAAPLAQYLILIVGVFACSTSVLFLKAATSHPIFVAAARLYVATIVLFPLMLLDARKTKSFAAFSPRRLARSMPGAIILSGHFMLWATGARMTPAANASMMVNLSPIALPFVMWLINGERINRGEILGTTIAMAGVIALVGQGFRVGDGTGFGDVVCFITMIVFCVYLAIGRRLGQASSSVFAYVVPLYAMAGTICLIVAICARVPWPVLTRAEVLRWIGLGLVPTVIGHTIFNHSIKHLRGQTISTINLTQFMYAGILAFFIFGEVPAAKMYVVAVVVAVGAVIVIRSNPGSPPAPEE